MAEQWGKWVPVIEHLLWQVYYRVLSFVSFHGPLSEAYYAAEHLSDGKGGRVYWVILDRVFRWDDVEISPGISTKVWFFGGPKNTVMARRGWWAMYLLEVQVKRVASVLGGSV